MLLAQRDRVERMLLTGRSLPFGEWRKAATSSTRWSAS